eukprot:jgi/Mesvir1/17124/Mv07556-RA.1
MIDLDVVSIDAAQNSEEEAILCTVISSLEVVCNGIHYQTNTHDSRGSVHFYVDVTASCFLVLFAGLMSGLTLALLSMDKMQLTILAKGGSRQTKKHAQRIIPLVNKHHLLLVTLLLANAMAAEALPIFLDRLVGPIAAVALSVTAVLLLGEVVPQAVCSRYGLAVGSSCSTIVWGLILLFYPLAWPLSKLLDLILGADSHGTLYRRAELKELVYLHSAPAANGQTASQAQPAEAAIIRGLLDMKDKCVAAAMTHLDNLFCLPTSATLDRPTLLAIQASGHSRVPVYHWERPNIVGVFLAKSLIGVRMGISVGELEILRTPRLSANTPLNAALEMLCSMRGARMAIVYEGGTSGGRPGSWRQGGFGRDGHGPTAHQQQNHYQPPYPHQQASQGEEIVGIVTLHDVLEHLLQVDLVKQPAPGGAPVPSAARFSQLLKMAGPNPDAVSVSL